MSTALKPHFNCITPLWWIINSSFLDALRKYSLQLKMQVKSVTKYNLRRRARAHKRATSQPAFVVIFLFWKDSLKGSTVWLTARPHAVNFLLACHLCCSERLQHKVCFVSVGVSEHYTKCVHRDRFMKVQNSWPVGKILIITCTDHVLTTLEQTSNWLLKEDFSQVFNSPSM